MLGKRKRSVVLVPPPKKRKNTSAIEEITFDFGAREDYLSGFHKRKLQRIKHAKEEAAKKDREERITARKLLREGRKADLENHVEAVNALLRKADGEVGVSSSEDDEVTEEAWHGIAEPVNIDYEADYDDEDRCTTVTIEAVDITRDGFQKVADANTNASNEEGEFQAEGAQATKEPTTAGKPVKGKWIWTKERPEGPKKKKKKFRYESKAERKLTRYKERSKNKAQAKSRKE